ncbi:hypothetical protein PHMEG_00034896, partial [Phytophthora megakarya]
MRSSYLLLIPTSALLMNYDVVCATQSVVASVEPETQPNLMDDGHNKRFLRSHKWIDEDAGANKEERGKGTEALNKLLSDGLSPTQGKYAINAMEKFSAEKKATLAQ